MIGLTFWKGRYEVVVPTRLNANLADAGAEWNQSRNRWILPPFIRLKHLQALDEVRVLADEEDVLRHEKYLGLLHGIPGLTDVAFDAPTSTKADPYQRVGAFFLTQARRAINADGLGLGKTVQAIVAADAIQARRVLISAKKSLLVHWQEMIAQFSVEPDVAVYTVEHKKVPNARFVVTNYDAIALRPDLLRPWDVFIIDEATWIKNKNARRTKGAWAVAKMAEYVWLLTGTLVRNQVDELWSLLHALRPSVYSSYWKFRKRVCIEKPVYGSGGAVITHKVVGIKNPTLLVAELRPYVIARPKSLVPLPPITHETIWVGMAPRQREFYDQLRFAQAAILNLGGVVIAKNALDQMIKLRQAACDLRLLDEIETEDEVQDGRPSMVGAKTEALVDLLQDLLHDEHKVLIFSAGAASRRYVHLLGSAITAATHGKTPIAFYHGGLNVEKRKKAIQEFEGGEAKVFLATLQSAGEGLNLQTADVVVWVDRSWVPVDVEQGEGRVHRRGQEKSVHVISLLTKNSVEEYVEKVLRGKLEVYQALDALREVVK